MDLETWILDDETVLTISLYDGCWKGNDMVNRRRCAPFYGCLNLSAL